MFLDLFVGICLILYFQVFLSHSMAGGAGTSLSQLALHRVVRDLHDQCMLVLVGALSAWYMRHHKVSTSVKQSINMCCCVLLCAVGGEKRTKNDKFKMRNIHVALGKRLESRLKCATAQESNGPNLWETSLNAKNILSKTSFFHRMETRWHDGINGIRNIEDRDIKKWKPKVFKKKHKQTSCEFKNEKNLLWTGYSHQDNHVGKCCNML